MNEQRGLRGLQRIWEPDPKLIAAINPAGATGSVLRQITVPLVDARVQTKISVSGYPTRPVGSDGTTAVTIPYDVTFGALIVFRLWLAIAERGPGTGVLVPTVNLLGTQAAPQNLPLDPSTMGWSETVLADGDAVIGEVTINYSGGAAAGFPPTAFWLKTRYSPAPGALFDLPEWQQLVRGASPSIPGNAFITGVT